MPVIKLLRSTTTGHTPSSLASGQVAINEADGILFWRDGSGTVKSSPISWSTFVKSLLDDADLSAAQTTMGISTFVKGLLDDADASTFFTTLGVSTFVKGLFDDTDASTFLGSLGFSTFVKGLIDDIDASTFLESLGFSTFVKGLVDDTDGATFRGSIGCGTAATHATGDYLPSTPSIATIPDQASTTFGANSGLTSIARLSATGNRTLTAPTGSPTDGQKVVVEHYASGGARTLSLTTGSSGAFAYGSDITSLTATVSGKTDLIGCIYNSTAQRWRVAAVVKGY